MDCIKDPDRILPILFIKIKSGTAEWGKITMLNI